MSKNILAASCTSTAVGVPTVLHQHIYFIVGLNATTAENIIPAKGETVKSKEKKKWAIWKNLLINRRLCSTISDSFVCASVQSKAALVGEIAVPCTRNPLQRG